MVLPQCLSGATFYTLKMAALPSPSLFRPLFNTPSLNPLLLSRPLKHSHLQFSLLKTFSLSSFSTQAIPTIPDPSETGVKTKWKAAIDFKWIRDNKDSVAVNIKNRNSTANLDLVLELYEKMLSLQKEVEQLRGERNMVANKMKGKMEPSERQKLVEEGKNLKEKLAFLEEDLVRLTDELQQEAQCIPNMTHPDVPIGDEDCSTLRKMVGSPRDFGFPIKDHIDLGKELDLFDFDAAAEVSGSKFYYLKNEAVLLEMALINWTLSEVTKRGFIPLTTPEIVRAPVVEKCGFQPRAENTQVYTIAGSDQCLIGTAEIPIGGLHMDSILSESSLPLKYVAYSHCFRTEAGAAGAATRILDMASSDLGAPAFRKFDVEAWMPGLGRYGEISSASNCTDYQSRRLGIRFRPESASVNQKKSKNAPTQYVHTLNATACAVPRMIVCLLENYQQEDGSVIIPEPLRPFMGGIDHIAYKFR
ncbi:unnamed protein product [Amaranthus hypochondriacus]